MPTRFGVLGIGPRRRRHHAMRVTGRGREHPEYDTCAAIPPAAFQLVCDPAVWQPRQTLLGNQRARGIPAQSFELRSAAFWNAHRSVQREAIPLGGERPPLERLPPAAAAGPHFVG
jgi:hypothetical protein